jgi:hypothetical protein
MKKLEGITEVAASIEKEMKAVGCGEGTITRCCDYRMVTAKHAKVFARCQASEHKRLMELCGHLTKIAYLHPNKRTRKTTLAFGVLGMEWQALLKSLCPVPKRRDQAPVQGQARHEPHRAIWARYSYISISGRWKQFCKPGCSRCAAPSQSATKPFSPCLKPLCAPGCHMATRDTTKIR